MVHFRLVLVCIAIVSCSTPTPIRYHPEWKLSNYEQLIIYNEEIIKAIRYAPHEDLYKLRQNAHEQAVLLYNRAQKHFGLPRVPFNGIKWEVLIYESGLAHCEENMISLNEIMFLRNYITFMHVTIPHEIAHLIAYQMGETWDGTHMGKKFRAVMIYMVGFADSIHYMDQYPSCVLNNRLANSRMSTCGSCRKYIPRSCESLKRN